MSTIRLGKRGGVWCAYVDDLPMPPIVLMLWLVGIWDKLTKPQRALLTAIGDGRTVQAHPKPWKRLHALLLLDDGELAPLGEAVLWAVKP